MSRLSLHSLAPILARQLSDTFLHQVQESDHPDFGGMIRADWGLADHGTTVGFVASCLYLHLVRIRLATDAPTLPDNDILFTHLDRAVDYLLRIQRPSGRIDLLDCNFDSSPDAAFAVQVLCPVIEMARPLAESDARLAAVLAKVEQFTYRATVGIADGGFHTPNHRWVNASALAQASRLFPTLELAPTINAYLAEGFDLDADGMFLEHSAGVYDAICDLSLLFLAEYWDCPPALPAVRTNLETNLHLLHADGSIETGLSRRQDYGTRSVPLHLAVAYLTCGMADANPRFVRAAEFLWEQALAIGQAGGAWLCYPLLKYGDPPSQTADDAALPTDFSRFFPHNGLWRVRHGLLSASFFRGVTRLLTLSYGQAELSSLKISQSYFGVGRFVGDSLEVEEGKGVFRSEGQSILHRPGYEFPLGKAVPPEQWNAVLPTRSYRALPLCTSTLTVEETEGGFDLRYQTIDGTESVPAQIALDFPAGGVWETDDVCFKPQAGQVLFLKRGGATMRYGNDVIAINPGADAHRTWTMRDTESAPGHVRVLFTFRTPVNHAFRIRAYRAGASSSK
jgi:hypothetical protein